MAWNPFKKFIAPKSFLGIDIGSSTIKVVELSQWRGKVKLDNYGRVSTSVIQRKPFLARSKNFLLLSAESISRAINAILEESTIKTRRVIFSIPDFSTFYTTFNLPPMPAEEVNQAVEFEARRHVPLSLSDVTLDWVSVNSEDSQTGGSGKGEKTILLVAIPNSVITQYQKIAELSGLEVLSLEGEVFSLVRALVDEKSQRAMALIDIGSRSTTVSIVDGGILRTSHSFDVSADELTMVIAKSLNIGLKVAEQLKREYGLLGNKERDLRKVLSPLVDLMLNETSKITRNYKQKTNRTVEVYIVAGGTALLPGLREYFSDWLKKEVRLANPFLDIVYPPVLEERLSKLGPSFAIVVGSALRGFKK